MNGDIRENVIEWITGDPYMTMTLTDRRLINKVRKLADELHDSRCVPIENADGSVFTHLPLSALKLIKKRTVELSDEQKKAYTERLAAARSRVKEREAEEAKA